MPRFLLILLAILTILPLSAKTRTRERRSGYTVRSVLVPVAEGDTAMGYLLTPRGRRPKGGWPAIVCLHDHGAHYTIGRDKCVHPLKGDSLIEDAEQWVNKVYTGQFVGDSLARAGYAVLTIDARYWGNRHPSMLQTDYWYQTEKRWADLILADDIATVDYLTRVRGINKERIGCFGFSMGGFRAWQLAATDKRIKVCAASHWMTTLEANRINDSWCSMRRLDMDNVEFGTIAGGIAPRPLLLQYGTKDKLFPVPATLKAFDIIRSAYGPTGLFSCMEYPAGHVFTPQHWVDLRVFLEKSL